VSENLTYQNMNKIILILFITGSLALSGCILKKQWTGYFYPNLDTIDDKSTWIIQPGLASLEDCREWVQSLSKNKSNFDYQCGYNCRFKKEYGETICESDAK
jgi:hypothetical protein